MGIFFYLLSTKTRAAITLIQLIVISGITLNFAIGQQVEFEADKSKPLQVMPKLLNSGESRLLDNQESQQKISKLFDSTKDKEQEYQQQLKLLEGLNVYNSMLQKQLDKQSLQQQNLKHSIANVSEIERQIMPLLVRMVDALGQLVALDAPFLIAEREQRIEGLQQLLEQPNLTLAEKTRRVFEAYQIESEYGKTIEAYKSQLLINDQKLAVNILRIGRIALLYQDLSGEQVGYWNAHENIWQPLTGSQYKRHINKGLRVAYEEISPELITIPLSSLVEAQ